MPASGHWSGVLGGTPPENKQLPPGTRWDHTPASVLTVSPSQCPGADGPQMPSTGHWTDVPGTLQSSQEALQVSMGNARPPRNASTCMTRAIPRDPKEGRQQMKWGRAPTVRRNLGHSQGLSQSHAVHEMFCDHPSTPKVPSSITGAVIQAPVQTSRCSPLASGATQVADPLSQYWTSPY